MPWNEVSANLEPLVSAVSHMHWLSSLSFPQMRLSRRIVSLLAHVLRENHNIRELNVRLHASADQVKELYGCRTSDEDPMRFRKVPA